MTTQVKKQEWQVTAGSLVLPNLLKRLKNGIQRGWRWIDGVLTWIFCVRLVRQIEPGKFETVELKHTSRPEVVRYWKGVN